MLQICSSIKMALTFVQVMFMDGGKVEIRESLERMKFISEVIGEEFLHLYPSINHEECFCNILHWMERRGDFV